MKYVAVNATLYARVELMEEFKAGKHSKWYPDYEIKVWKEREVELAKAGEEGEATGESSTPRVESPRTTEPVQVEVIYEIATQGQDVAKDPIVEHGKIAQEYTCFLFLSYLKNFDLILF